MERKEKIIGSSASGIYLNFIPPSSSSSQYTYSETWKWFLLIGTRVDAFYGCSQLSVSWRSKFSLSTVCAKSTSLVWNYFLYEKLTEAKSGNLWFIEATVNNRVENRLANSRAMINFDLIPAMIFCIFFLRRLWGLLTR